MIYNLAVSVVILLYVLVAVFAFFATTSEQQRNGVRALLPRLMGVLACLAWPLVALAMLFSLKKPSRR